MASIVRSFVTLSRQIIVNPSTSLCSKRHFNGSACLSSYHLKKKRPSTESLIIWKKLPTPKSPPKDRWDSKRALFGENDYKDLLGDGTYPLRKNVITGPFWMRGWKGNEFQRLVRKKAVMGRDMGPKALKEMKLRIRYLYKRLNRNLGPGYYKT